MLVRWQNRTPLREPAVPWVRRGQSKLIRTPLLRAGRVAPRPVVDVKVPRRSTEPARRQVRVVKVARRPSGPALLAFALQSMSSAAPLGCIAVLPGCDPGGRRVCACGAGARAGRSEVEFWGGSALRRGAARGGAWQHVARSVA